MILMYFNQINRCMPHPFNNTYIYVIRQVLQHLSGYIIYSLSLYATFVLFYGVAQAQVNIERSRPSQTEGARLDLEGGLTLIRGNINLTQTTLGGRS